MVKIGDRIVVQGIPFPAFVENIEDEPSTARTVIHLDWRQYGKSLVYLHDEGKVWFTYADKN
jgi:hypothetical protein